MSPVFEIRVSAGAFLESAMRSLVSDWVVGDILTSEVLAILGHGDDFRLC
jgi:hypothetical protein